MQGRLDLYSRALTSAWVDVLISAEGNLPFHMLSHAFSCVFSREWVCNQSLHIAGPDITVVCLHATVQTTFPHTLRHHADGHRSDPRMLSGPSWHVPTLHLCMRLCRADCSFLRRQQQQQQRDSQLLHTPKSRHTCSSDGHTDLHPQVDPLHATEASVKRAPAPFLQ